jgi:3-hydroxybutyrate dehydrogenase
MQLKDKTAIITGASSGIGKEIARHFVREGARVAIATRDVDEARAAAQEIDPGGSSTLAVEMDVTSEDLVNSGVEQVCRDLGGVDILVSNAGIQTVGALDRYAFDDWKKLLAVHLDGAFLTTRACLQRMYAQGRGGSIIYIGSVHSKHGLIGLAKVVAKEGADHGVRSNVICPGYVRTKLVEKQIPEQARQLGISEADVISKVMLAQTVDGEFTTLDDVARCAAFLAAFPSNALTGQSIVVSHGWYMQ